VRCPLRELGGGGDGGALMVYPSGRSAVISCS
jgi:hypothetical protein